MGELSTGMTAGAERIRIEAEYDGKIRTIELVARPGEKIPFSLDVETEARELPGADLWREWAPTGRVGIRLKAIGHRADPTIEGGHHG